MMPREVRDIVTETRENMGAIKALLQQVVGIQREIRDILLEMQEIREVVLLEHHTDGLEQMIQSMEKPS